MPRNLVGYLTRFCPCLKACLKCCCLRGVHPDSSPTGYILSILYILSIDTPSLITVFFSLKHAISPYFLCRKISTHTHHREWKLQEGTKKKIRITKIIRSSIGKCHYIGVLQSSCHVSIQLISKAAPGGWYYQNPDFTHEEVMFRVVMRGISGVIWGPVRPGDLTELHGPSFHGCESWGVLG